MNWVKYLEENSQIQDVTDTKSIQRAVDLAALGLQYKYGWYNYSVICSPTTLHFMYTNKDGLFTAMIPVERIVTAVVVKPLLEEVVKAHSESIPSYRRNLQTE